MLSFYTKASLRYKSLRISQDAPGIQVDFVQKFDINSIFCFLLFQEEKQKQWDVLLSSFCLRNIMCFCNNFWNVNLRFPYRRKNRSVASVAHPWFINFSFPLKEIAVSKEFSLQSIFRVKLFLCWRPRRSKHILRTAKRTCN